MVDAISSNSSITQAKLLKAAATNQANQTQQAQKSDQFGNAFNVSLSSEAQAILKENQDIYDGLSNDQVKKLNNSLSQIDKIFQAAGDGELTAEQEKQLASLEQEVEGIIGKEKTEKLFGGGEKEEDLFANLSSSDADLLKGIIKNIDTIFDQAGDKPLSAENKKKLEEFAKQADGVLGSETSKIFREDLNSAISEQS